MPWKKVNGMPDTPQCCIACGGNSADVEGKQQPALWAEGVDVDWGNMVYLCWECVEIIADLAGRATRGGFDDLEAEKERLAEELEELREKYDHAQSLLDKIREGSAAQKQVRQTARR